MKLIHVLAAATVSVALGCSSGGSSGSGGSGGSQGSPGIEDSLNALGVDTSRTDRVGPDQEPLPDDYGPLGSSASFGAADAFGAGSGFHATSEVFIGVAPGVFDPPASAQVEVAKLNGVGFSEGVWSEGQTDQLVDLSAGNDWVTDPWISPLNWQEAMALYGLASLRDVAAADVDGDGLDEIVVVYLETPSATPVLTLDIIDDEEANFAETTVQLGEDAELQDVAIVAGDFNGDGIEQIAVGLSRVPGGSTQDRPDPLLMEVELLLLTIDGGVPSLLPISTSPITQAIAGSLLTVELASGNFDYDSAAELAVVVNDTTVGNNLQLDDGAARFWVFDDEKTDFAVLDTGDVLGRDDQGPSTFEVADVSTGDIDADGVDEVIFGGLTTLVGPCNSAAEAMVYALDDAEHGLSELPSLRFASQFSCNGVFAPVLQRFVHVNAVDLQGDGIPEVSANQFVLRYQAAEGRWDELAPIPFGVFDRRCDVLDINCESIIPLYASATSSVFAADVTGDGSEDIVVYVPWNPGAQVYGLRTVDDENVTKLASIDVAAHVPLLPPSGIAYVPGAVPLVVPANVNHDSVVLRYSGEHALVFTEPLVIAALAAAPCADGIGQNVDACYTAFGNSESTSVTGEVTYSLTAKVKTGAVAGEKLIGGEGKTTQSLAITASLSIGGSYSYTKSELFTSGPQEDVVIFTTVPYDQYVYTTLSHPDPTKIGEQIVVMTPREPVTLMVERGFYNANLASGNLPIGDNVFAHTVGDLGSYMSPSEKDAILDEYAVFDGRFENGPLAVGQGTGATELGIAIGNEVSVTGSLALEYEIEVELTVGAVGVNAIGGYSVGAGFEASLGVTSGSETTYTGSVGNLDAANFSEHGYSYGMFTYVQEITDSQGNDLEFEVINYWVE